MKTYIIIMEIYDSTIIIQKADCRIHDKVLMQFLEDTIIEYLQDRFIVIKKHYESQCFTWVNYSTIYANLQEMFHQKTFRNEQLDFDKINMGLLANTEVLCLCILNKFIPLYELPKFDNEPNIRQYEYIFISIT